MLLTEWESGSPHKALLYADTPPKHRKLRVRGRPQVAFTAPEGPASASVVEEKPVSVPVTEENTFKMLEFFQREWEYRHRIYWSTLFKLSSLNILVSMLPYIVGMFGITFDVSKIPAYLFPLVGMPLAVMCFFIMRGEAKRLSAVGKAKYRINRNMAELYRYETFEKREDTSVIPKPGIADFIPKMVLAFQLLVCVIELAIMLLP